METTFKIILSAINQVAAMRSTNDLFEKTSALRDEDKFLLETWSGKSIEQIRNIISTSFGKRQLIFDPFANTSDPVRTPLVFSRFDENSKFTILYSCEPTDYGQIIIASTDEGVCYLVFFSGDESKIPGILQKEFPASTVVKGKNEHQETALNYLKGISTKAIHLHVKGTPDNLQIWEALSRVPSGKLVSYGTLAKATKQMAQDIGVAMGDNRIAMLIPCHRVIRSTGELGQYHWGAKRKQAMIIKEAVVA